MICGWSHKLASAEIYMFPLAKPHPPHMPHHSSPEQVLNGAPRTEGQTKVRIPPNSSKWGLNEPHAAWSHCSVPTLLSVSPQQLPCVIWSWMRGSAVSTGSLHLCTHHLRAFFPLHAAAGFLLHMFHLPQLEAVRVSLIYMLCAGRTEVCKFLVLCMLAGPQ